MRTYCKEVNLAAKAMTKEGREWFVIALRNEKTGEQLGVCMGANEAYDLLVELRNFFADRAADKFAKAGFAIFEKDKAEGEK